MGKLAARSEESKDGLAARLQGRAQKLEKAAGEMQDEARVLRTAASRLTALAALVRKSPKRH